MKEYFEDLERMREEYEQIKIPPEGLTAVKEAMELAKINRRSKKQKSFFRSFGLCAAAVVTLMIMLPNLNVNIAYAMSNIPVIGSLVEVVCFQEYEADEERFRADVEIPELTVSFEDFSKGNTGAANLYSRAADQINTEIRLITGNLLQEFEESMQVEGSYGELLIRHEILATADEYFTLKLITYWGGGSGYEKNYYYTIDLRTGKRLALADLFHPGADYVNLISKNIKSQMREQMAEDPDVIYWIDQDLKEGAAAWNFEKIKENQSFYVDKKGQIVITFSEGDVAPMASGCVEFVIPNTLLEKIRI